MPSPGVMHQEAFGKIISAVGGRTNECIQAFTGAQEALYFVSSQCTVRCVVSLLCGKPSSLFWCRCRVSIFLIWRTLQGKKKQLLTTGTKYHTVIYAVSSCVELCGSGSPHPPSASAGSCACPTAGCWESTDGSFPGPQQLRVSLGLPNSVVNTVCVDNRDVCREASSLFVQPFMGHLNCQRLTL